MAILSSYVYLMVEHDGRAFKIGTSIDPKMRSYQLHNVIDYDRSLQFKFDGRQAAKAERMLHFMFRGYHQKREKADGYTEWFDIDCLSLAKRFLWTMRDLVGWTEWSVIAPTGGIAKSPDQAKTITEAAARKALADAHREIEAAQALERVVRRKIETARLEATRIRALTDRGLSAGQIKRPRKAKRAPEPVKTISLGHLHPMSAQRDPGRWLNSAPVNPSFRPK